MPFATSVIGGGWSVPCSGSLNIGENLAPFVQEAGLALKAVRKGSKNLAFTEIRFADRQVRRQYLQRLG